MGEIRWGQIIQYRWLLVHGVTFCSNPFSGVDKIHTFIQLLDLVQLENCPSCETML
jgi:hypothetical protein